MSGINHWYFKEGTGGCESFLDFLRYPRNLDTSKTDTFALFGTQGTALKPVPFNLELAGIMHRFLLDNINEDFRFLTPPSFLETNVRGELKRYMIAIQAYVDSYSEKTVPFTKVDLVNGILNKSYSSYLKKVKTCSILTSFGNMKAHIFDESLEGIPGYSVEDIGEIFNYTYCFFWEEEDSEDWKYSMIDLPEGYHKYEKRFKKALWDLLEGIDPGMVTEMEILLGSSNSSCLKKGGGKRSQVFLEKQKHNYFSEKPIRGERQMIAVHPSGYRDAVVLEVPTLNSLQLIEKQCAEIAALIPHSLYIQDPELIFLKLKRFWLENSSFLNRDIEKEGLTKPRYLVKWILEVLKEKYPTFPAWRYSGIYDDFILIMEDGSEVRTKRGHGLGMANAITTIMQSTLFEMTKSQFEKETGIDSSLISAVFYNDDCVIAFKNDDDLDSYIDIEETLFTKIGLRWSKKKSHWGTECLLCELYPYKRMNEKRSYRWYEMYLPYACINITHAKELVASLTLPEWVSVGEYLSELRSFWGYEFFPEEISLPRTLGGWLPARLFGYDVSFFCIDDRIEEDLISAAALAHCEAKTDLFSSSDRRKGDHQRYLNPAEGVFKNLSFGDFSSVFGLHKTVRDARIKNHRSLDSDSVCSYYERLKKKRRKFFSTFRKRKFPLREVFSRISQNEKISRIVDPDPICFYNLTSFRSVFDDPYVDYRNINPKVCYMHYYNRYSISPSLRTVPDPRWAVDSALFSTRTLYRLNRHANRDNIMSLYDPTGDIMTRLKYRRGRDQIKVPCTSYKQFTRPKELAIVYYVMTGRYILPKREEVFPELSDLYISLIEENPRGREIGRLFEFFSEEQIALLIAAPRDDLEQVVDELIRQSRPPDEHPNPSEEADLFAERLRYVESLIRPDGLQIETIHTIDDLNQDLRSDEEETPAHPLMKDVTEEEIRSSEKTFLERIAELGQQYQRRNQEETFDDQEGEDESENISSSDQSDASEEESDTSSVSLSDSDPDESEDYASDSDG